jgi:putative pyruvate formate lyase activating enzyme
VFCQNYEISQNRRADGTASTLGRKITEEALADEMLKLQEKGALNINLVSPTHYGKQILNSLTMAKKKGLKIPIVYNSNGYDRIEMLKRFEGLIDVYLPDMKYGDGPAAKKYSRAPRYVEVNQAAIGEMFRQVGSLQLDKNGIARRGLLVRHLVLPNRLAGSFAVLDFLAGLSTEIWLSLMSQYYPIYRAEEFAEINRPITPAEYQEVVDYALDLGFENILGQDLSSHAVYRPRFKRAEVFENIKSSKSCSH